jgi:uncharacterized protein
MEIIGYIASVVIGISLGLIGGGGSILTVPVLVYLFGVNPVLATAYSLFIVGATSLAGVIPKYKQGLVNIKTAVIFGTPAIAAVYATRKWIVPAIPDEVFTLAGFTVTKPILMMIKGKNEDENSNNGEQQFNYPLILVEGAVVGILTGLVGAGGGFLIIPALVLLSKLPMKQAVGTSLLIIAAKSLIGFLGDVGHQVIDWKLLIIITLLAIAGIFIGNALSKKISGDKLKRGFGWFVLVMGIYIIVKELFIR